VIHYHGTPITPRAKLLELVGRNFCVSYAAPRDVEVCHEIGQSVMLDNGAFTFWRRGGGGRAARDWDWRPFYRWAEPWLEHHTTWAVIPDVIDGDEEDNDRLLVQWFQTRLRGGAPVWHMHESIERLQRLSLGYERVCIGSSGEYATVGDERWHRRMREAMDALCGNGPPPCWLHMLRGLSLAGSDYPFASADSTLLAQNHAGNNTRGGPAKDIRRMADEIDGRQCPAGWVRSSEPVAMEV
jgi:hypothetical protein